MVSRHDFLIEDGMSLTVVDNVINVFIQELETRGSKVDNKNELHDSILRANIFAGNEIKGQIEFYSRGITIHHTNFDTVHYLANPKKIDKLLTIHLIDSTECQAPYELQKKAERTALAK